MELIDRTVSLEDRPDALALIIEWRADDGAHRQAFRLPKETGDDIHTNRGMLARAQLRRVLELAETDQEYTVAVTWRLDDDVVRRDVHVILKQGSVVADAMASTF